MFENAQHKKYINLKCKKCKEKYRMQKGGFRVIYYAIVAAVGEKREILLLYRVKRFFWGIFTTNGNEGEG